MPTLILIIIVYWLVIAFISVSPENIINPFLAYADIQIGFIREHFSVFGWGFILLSILFAVFTGKKGGFLRKYLRFLERFSVLILTGFVAALFILFMIALIQVNIVSILTYISPRTLGIETNSQTISENLKVMRSAPIVISGDEKGKHVSLMIAIAQSGKMNFYGSRILASTPNFLVLPAKKTDEGVLMVGNTLIIKKINSPDFQLVSPILGHLMIKNYFPGRNIKTYPKVEFMDKSGYLGYRKEDFANKLKLFDELIAKVENEIMNLTNLVSEEKEKLEENRIKLDASSKLKEKEYSKCINTGHYEDGIYVRTNSKTYCQERTLSYQELVSDIEKEGENLENSLREDEEKLKQYQGYAVFYKGQKLLTQEESFYISYEFGTFSAPETIKISLTTQDNSQTLADYLELLVHEYLHYSSFDETGKRISSSFFEEGITEYFARRITEEHLKTKTNMGYPVVEKIISQMTKRISERDLADIYFANDQAGLEKLLDRIYEEDFYNNNIVMFETLQYTSEKGQILNLANKIMEVIGGEAVNESDLTTTYSTFQ